MKEISNGKMVKGCLKVKNLFKTDNLPKCFAPHHEPFLCRSIFLGPDHFNITKFSCTL